MQNITTLIFDLGGVIINLKTEPIWLQENLATNFHTEKLNTLRHQNFFNRFETGEISVSDFIRQLMSISVSNIITQEEINKSWNGILLDIPIYRIELLKELKQRYRLILLSNTNHIHMDYIRIYMHQEFGEDILDSIFHKCFYSQEIGLRKPDKEIYEYVLQQENLQAENCLFLDDKAENLIEPQKLGIQTILVDKDITVLLNNF